MRRLGLLAALGLMSGRRANAGPVGDWLRERAAARRAAEGGSAGVTHGRGDRGEFELPAGAVLTRDLPYGPDPAHRLDLYRPAAGVADGSLVLMVHGGGWAQGDKAMWRTVRHKVAHWVGAGRVFVSINYRLLPDAGPLEQADDVARALAFVQDRAGSWGAQPDKLVLVGHSSGAHLVALLGSDATLAQRHGGRPWRATLSLDSAAFDIERIMRARHLRLYDHAFGDDPAYWREASPLHRLQRRSLAPMLIVCSNRRNDSCDQARVYADKAQRLGGRVEVLPVDLSHAEINDLLGSEGPYTQAAERFLRDHEGA